MPEARQREPRLVRWMKRLESARLLDPVVDRFSRLTRPLTTNATARALLRGRWLGHAVHPVLTDLPLGAWASAGVLDLVGGRDARPAAQRLVGLGIVMAAPTIVTGWAEWAAADRPAQRVGVVHAVSNSAALGLYTLSWLARRRGGHKTGMLLGLAAGAAAGTGGYLGSHLTEVRQVASYHPAFDTGESRGLDAEERRGNPAPPQAPRAEFHVSVENEIWKVERYGHDSSEHSTQRAAIAAAREQAAAARPSRVVVHGADGFARDEVSYDVDVTPDGSART
ncbi:DUF2231 domain-containing protein [Microlunatus soli]|uniref:Uncharacterized membrane protein n=1 Tax=Microlunatus soli TaxID=630515 RepID=A0A1H1N545_9ACTN|nr:DUF2188 domain-containing protein [Microlunatus soli]SDR94116.1 Uncharacterized membrane protein [Microlunatus soli]